MRGHVGAASRENGEQSRGRARRTRAVWLERAEERWRLGDVRGAQDAARRAFDQARRSGDPDGMLQAAVLYAGPCPRPAGFDRLGRYLDEALAALPREDSTVRASGLSLLALASFFAVPGIVRSELVREAFAMAERLGDPATLVTVAAYGHGALWEPEYLERRVVLTEGAIETAEKRGNPAQRAVALRLRLTDNFVTGDLVGVARDLGRLQALAEQVGEPSLHSLVDWEMARFEAATALLRGEVAQAPPLLERALSLGVRVEEEPAHLSYGLQAFRLQADQGDWVSLAEGLARRPTGPGGPGVRHALASLCLPDVSFSWPEFWNDPGRMAGSAVVCLGLGDLMGARRELALLGRVSFVALSGAASRLAAVALLAEVCRELGEGDRALELYDILQPHRDRWITLGPAPGCLQAHASLPLAVLAEARGDGALAARHYETAVKRHEEIGAVPRLAEARLGLARVLLARGTRGDRSRANGLLAANLAQAEPLGLNAVVRETRRVLSNSFRSPGRAGRLRQGKGSGPA